MSDDPNDRSQRPDNQPQNPSGPYQQPPYQQPPYQQWQQPPPQGYQQPPTGYPPPPPGGYPTPPGNQAPNWQQPSNWQPQAQESSNSGVWGWVIFILIFGLGNLILYSTTGWFIIPIPRR